MGLAERKAEEKQVEPEQKPALLDAGQMFAARSLPFREVAFEGADGTKGTILVQALSKREMDEINHLQEQPVVDGKGTVIREADQIGWDAKVVARALRNPNRTRVVTEHWPAKAEEISDTWLPGVVQYVRGVVLEMSGYGIKARAELKKDS